MLFHSSFNTKISQHTERYKYNKNLCVQHLTLINLNIIGLVEVSFNLPEYHLFHSLTRWSLYSEGAGSHSDVFIYYETCIYPQAIYIIILCLVIK